MVPIKEALTFDDVTLVPKYSEILPSEVEGLNDMSINYDTDSDQDPTCDI